MTEDLQKAIQQRRSVADAKLCEALRFSGLTVDDLVDAWRLYELRGPRATSIMQAMRAIEAWMREGGAR